MSKIIGIIGARSRNSNDDYWDVYSKFFEIYEPGDIICSGGCPKGGDSFAYKFHKEYAIPYLEFPADWKKHGNAAGFIRNSDIAKFSHDLIACVSEDRIGGTEDTIHKFLKQSSENNLHLV